MKELNENELDQVSGGHRFTPDKDKDVTHVGAPCGHRTSYDTCTKKCFYYEKGLFHDYCTWYAHHD